MAYPTGLLAVTLTAIDNRLINLKAWLIRARDTMAAGNVGSAQILAVYTRLRDDRVYLASVSATPGLADYAKAQKNNPNLDVVAEFNAVLAAINSATAWVGTNFPKDGSNYLLAQTLGTNAPVDRQFTPAQTAGFRTVIDSVIATIA